jgi:hypothetical protein
MADPPTDTPASTNVDRLLPGGYAPLHDDDLKQHHRV